MASFDKLFAAAPPHPDNPVPRGGRDELGRAEFAAALASQIGHAPKDGFVMALTGPWGSGKTSLLNLVEDQLDEEKVVRFNPWLISGTEQLVEQFFGELGGQLEEKEARFKEVGKLLKEYGARLRPFEVLPFAGAWIGRAASAAEVTSKMIEAAFPEGSLEQRREEIRKELDKQATRIVVMIDDIDRLEDDEIRQIMRLVRLVGDFPHIVYLLAFDGDRVAEVLGAGRDPEEGRRFLQKIVQIPYAVPAIGNDQLAGLLSAEIAEKLKAVRRRPNQERLDLLTKEVLVRSVSTVREVRRYANALPFALGVRGGQVDVVDLLALEAARFFMGPVHDGLPGAARMLTSRKAPAGKDEQEALAAELDELVGGVPDERVARAWVDLVFPGVGMRLAGERPPTPRARRVANQKTLWIYLQKALPGEIISSEAVDAAADAFIKGGPLRAFLAYDRSLFNQLLEWLPERVEELSGPDERQAVARKRAELSLLDVLVRTSQVNRDGVIAVGSVHAIHELMRLALEPLAPAERCEVAWHLLEAVEGPRMRRWVADGVHPSSRSREPLVDAECGEALRRRVCDEIRGLSREELVDMPGLAVLLNWVARVDGESVPELQAWLDDPDVFGQYLATVPSDTANPWLLRGLRDREERLTAVAATPEPPRGRARQAWKTAARLTGAR